MTPLAASLALTPRTLRHAVTYPPLAADAYLVVEAGEARAVTQRARRPHPSGSRTANSRTQRSHDATRSFIRDEAGVRILDDRSENGVSAATGQRDPNDDATARSDMARSAGGTKRSSVGTR